MKKLIQRAFVVSVLVIMAAPFLLAHREYNRVAEDENRYYANFPDLEKDGKWNSGNVWNGNLVNLFEAPEDGVYRYTATVAVSGAMFDVNTFNIGFRCDYWASGMYRVRYVKVEKGDTSTEWSPGL